MLSPASLYLRRTFGHTSRTPLSQPWGESARDASAAQKPPPQPRSSVLQTNTRQALPAHLTLCLLLLLGIALMPAAAAAQPSTEAKGPSAASEDRQFTARFDPAGFGFFGPSVSLEYGRQLSVSAKYRTPQLGLGSQLLLVDDWYGGIDGGFGLGTSVRFYPQRPQAGFFIGGGAEYFSYRWYGDDEDVPDEYVSEGHKALIVPTGEFGYRWTAGHFIFGIGAALGAGIPVVDQRDGRDFNAPDDVQFFGAAQGELGFAF